MLTVRLYYRALVAAVALTGLAASSGAWAQDQRPGQGEEQRESRFIRMMDTDEDGKVSLKEITDEQKRLVAAADVNGDGKLSVKEFRRRGHWFMRMRATTLFDLMDVDGDGQLTADEITGPSARWFKRYDGNGDGVLASDELPQRHMGRRGGRRGGRMGGPMQHRGGPPGR